MHCAGTAVGVLGFPIELLIVQTTAQISVMPGPIAHTQMGSVPLPGFPGNCAKISDGYYPTWPDRWDQYSPPASPKLIL